ncbi:MAG: hypothetical protein ACI9KS_001333 [Sulfitobacter sp.]|jgi:hypothetical protein
MRHTIFRASALVFIAATLAACGGGSGGFLGFGGDGDRAGEARTLSSSQRSGRLNGEETRESIFSLFAANDDPNTTVEVNKYLWVAVQDVLDFLPIETVDPFTGVIVYGYGTPPGGGRSYRATVFVQDPALEARSIKVSLATRGGTAPRATSRAVEDAILTRARQLRIQDSNL